MLERRAFMHMVMDHFVRIHVRISAGILILNKAHLDPS